MRMTARGAESNDLRFKWLQGFFLLLLAVIVLRLGYLQIMQHGLYALYASDQHSLEQELNPERGSIYVRDKSTGELHPLATNRLSWQIYAVPRDMTDIVGETHTLATTLNLPEADLVAKFTRKQNDVYEPVMRDAPQAAVDALQAADLPGVGFVQSSARAYPDPDMGGQLIGFMGVDASGTPRGQYGIEGAYNDLLAGTPGELETEKDAGGHALFFAQTKLKDAVNGSNIVLTVDPVVQYQACAVIQAAVAQHQADVGSIVIMDPKTGAIMAMCSSPDFDPNNVGKVPNLGVLNNPVTYAAYEPGSVFKAFTMAAGIDAGKISPNTTYVDTGSETIDNFTIHNSEAAPQGLQTMTTALDASLNTVAIFVERLIGRDDFRAVLKQFGFGAQTGIGLTPESKGDVSALDKKGDVFSATASFGQGITVTPLQLVTAYGALANGGKLMKPYIVDEIDHPDGSVTKTKPQVVDQAVSARTAELVGGMLVSVVEFGLGKHAAVPGYWVAGKTGTAQVARTDGVAGYQKDVTIGSFAGFAPADNPRFVMLVEMVHPRDVQWAETSAAPIFGQMAKFMLTYLQVPPERPIDQKLTPPVIPNATSTPLTASSTTSTL